MNGEKWVIVKNMYHYCLRCTLQLLLMNGETCERRAKRRAKRRVSGACAWLRGQAVFLGNTQSSTHAARVSTQPCGEGTATGRGTQLCDTRVHSHQFSNYTCMMRSLSPISDTINIHRLNV